MLKDIAAARSRSFRVMMVLLPFPIID